ncbi:unnamed protein product [Paramecium octaurelia]|uniref:HMG box domain-containing protein n=1 Tax=Paramecium octaurelia TaxID=43137 RepID=A0A8S1VD39_PAROT|nr:unnamed protein product [Paramecium octaurelia]
MTVSKDSSTPISQIKQLFNFSNFINMQKQRLKQLQLDQPGPKKQSSAYRKFYDEQLVLLQQQYPKRTTEELIKLINLKWKVKEKMNKQKYFQKNGYVNINDTERVPVPQPPPPVMIIFQKQMRKQLEMTHPEYNGTQIDRTIKFEWGSNSALKEKAAEEYKKLRQEFENQKKEFIIKYGFWPQHKKHQGESGNQIQHPSQQANPLACLLNKKVKYE